MLPKRGMDVKFTDIYISRSGKASLKGAKITILKLDLLNNNITGGVQYKIMYTNSGKIDTIDVDVAGRDLTYGADVFESWVGTQSIPRMTINVSPGFGAGPAISGPAPKASPYVGASGPIPKNNEGRASCFWCGAPTVKKLGLLVNYDFCDKCGK